MRGDGDFRALAEAAFAPLIQRYGLGPISSVPERIELASRAVHLAVSLERTDLFVDISSTEDNPIHRTKISLPELVQCSVASNGELPSEAPPPRQTLRQRLEAAAALLERYGARELAGDFSVRPRLLELRARAWLASKYHDIVEARLYPNPDEGLAQVKWEYARFRKDEGDAAWSELERWLQSDNASRRAFAERVVAVL